MYSLVASVASINTAHTSEAAHAHGKLLRGIVKITFAMGAGTGWAEWASAHPGNFSRVLYEISPTQLKNPKNLNFGLLSF